MDRTAADDCGIGDHKKSGAKQIEQDADDIPLLHTLSLLAEMCYYLHRRKNRQKVPKIGPGAELFILQNDGTGFLALDFTEVPEHDRRNEAAILRLVSESDAADVYE